MPPDLTFRCEPLDESSELLPQCTGLEKSTEATHHRPAPSPRTVVRETSMCSRSYVSVPGAPAVSGAGSRRYAAPAGSVMSADARVEMRAIEMLTRSWALELAEENVGVNAVAPGPQRVRPLPRRGYPGERSTRSNRKRQIGFRSDDAANPRTSRPGSSTSRTLPPLGSPDRFSPSTVALNSPDRQRLRSMVWP